MPPFTKDMSKEDPTHNTVYVAAVPATGSCSQDIEVETAEYLMQLKASRSDNTAQSYGYHNMGDWRVDINSQDVSTSVRLPRFGKTPNNQ